jgi:signal transduction histidine kinase
VHSSHNALGVYSDRTLDEAYYPSLPYAFLKERNTTQVVQKQFRRIAGRDQYRNLSEPILMVPQLWLWRINDYLLSSNSMQALFNEEPQDERPRHKSRSMDLQMLDIIIEHIEAFGKARVDAHTGQTFPSTLATFETALVETLSDVRDYMTKRESQVIDIKLERDFLEAISDIRNELDMIKTVMQQQQDVLNDYLGDKTKNAPRREEAQRLEREIEDLELRLKNLNAPWPAEGIDKKDALHAEIQNVRAKLSANPMKDFREFRHALEEAKRCIAKYTNRIDTIDRDAEKVAKSIDDMLNLSRVEASIREARASIEEARASTKEARNSVVIGWAALAFAIVTVVFTPLSFAASLMALPVDRFVEHQYGSGVDGGDDGRSARVFKAGYIVRTFGKSVPLPQGQRGRSVERVSSQL